MLGFVPERKIDFHEFGPMFEYDIEKLLVEFLEDAYIAKCTFVLVVTGKGKVVRPLVQRLLASSRFVAKFETAGYFNGQSGAFEVELKH